MTRKFSKIFLLILCIICLGHNSFSQPNIVPLKSQLVPSFADTIEDLLPTVVNISTSLDYNINDEDSANNSRSFLDERTNREPDSRRKITSIGSGFIISPDGYIVTNGHVIEDSVDININLHDGSKYKAKLVGVDKKTDLALLKINSSKELKFAKFGDSNKSRIGDWAIVIGNPYGLGGSVSIGIISARGRDINTGQLDEYIQTDAAINKGNSGGPLFNSKGEVVGINSAIFSPSGGSVGIGFATPSNNALQVINQIREVGEVYRGWIGVSVQDLTDELADSLRLDKIRGAFVSDVVVNGPASKAGVLPTDVIIRFDDQEVDDMKSLPKIVNRTPINKIVKVQVWRHGKTKTLNLIVEKSRDDENKIDSKKFETKILDKKPQQKLLNILGISLAEYKNNGVEGLIVNDIAPKSEAIEKGIIVGDIILSINQNNINSLENFKEIIRDQTQKNKKVFLFLKRNNNNFAVVLNIK
ncbi:MAG: Do family serine endopeptidase [Proteobacteria bacterium]|nr:Do family serine endopeptidase [Pseudomonadota bacterium]NCA27680.1 Do family serine endopeptidase [Pseudomonadota bacterium]